MKYNYCDREGVDTAVGLETSEREELQELLFDH